MSPDRLSIRALNRATLARQLLLEPAHRPVLDVVEHLVGLQAQAPNAPYVALWSRLADFHPDGLAELLTGRGVVRAPLLRTTVHLVSARDWALLWPLTAPVLRRTFAASPFGRDLAGVDLDAVVDAARVLLDEAPRTSPELGTLLRERWPDRDAASLAYAVHYLSPVVQVPPRGVWGATGPARWAGATAWLGRQPDQHPAPEELILRYFGAFGPATVADVQTWSGLTRLREVGDRLRPRLAVFRDEAGRELFDLPDAPRPDPDTPAPPRFLPEYDNVLLSHADRSRMIPDDGRPRLFAGNGGTQGTVLVDGLLRCTWKIVRSQGAATLTVTAEPALGPALGPADAAAVRAEGARLLGFAAAGAEPRDVRLGVA